MEKIKTVFGVIAMILGVIDIFYKKRTICFD
jgi:hypothetical protein